MTEKMSKIDEIIERARKAGVIKDYKNDPYVPVEFVRELKPYVELAELMTLNSDENATNFDKRHFNGEYPNSNIYKFITQIKIQKSKDKLNELATAVEPLMQYLAENHHPHVTAIVTSAGAELVEGICTHRTDKFIKY